MSISWVGAIQGSASTGSASSASSQTPEANDVIVVFGYQRATTTTLSVAATGLTFNQIVAPSGNTTYGSFGAWWARYPSATNPTITVTGSSSTNLSIGVVGIVFRGVDTSSTPTTNVGTITDQTSASTYQVTGPTGLPSGTVMVGLVGSMDDNALSGGWQSGSELLSVQQNITTGSDACLYMDSQFETTGTCGTFQTTLASNGPDAGRTLIFGLKPFMDPIIPRFNVIPGVAVSQSSRW